jgi:hypothetical protein
VNRLNRIKYQKSYNELEESVVKEVIDDLLINKAHADSIHKFFDKIKIVDIDIDFNNLFWDGILKNNGLQNCSNEIVFQIDLDERVSGTKEFSSSWALYLHPRSADLGRSRPQTLWSRGSA